MINNIISTDNSIIEKNSFISIIIPLYNAEKYISLTLDSVISQTYQEWECIVVDDGSHDSSAEIVKEYIRKDSRISYVKQKNAGPSKARNNGLNRAKGDYIQFLDADDVILPDRFSILLKTYEECNDRVVLYSDILLGENDDIYITKTFKSTSIGKDLNFKLMYSCFGRKVSFIPGAILFPKQCFDGCKWSENLKYSEDWELYLQITKCGYLFRNFPTKLFIYRNSEGSLSKNYDKVLEANYYILYTYFCSIFLHIYIKRITSNIYKNILHIKHKRSGRFILPYKILGKCRVRAIILSIISAIYLPIYIIKIKCQKP